MNDMLGWKSCPQVCGCMAVEYRSTSLIRNNSPLWDDQWALDRSLLYGPRKGWFLMSEVTQYGVHRQATCNMSPSGFEQHWNTRHAGTIFNDVQKGEIRFQAHDVGP
jgi:hypothetical protein